MSSTKNRHTLPDHVTEDDVRRAAADAETILDVSRQLRIDRVHARALLRDRDLLDQVGQATYLGVVGGSEGEP